MDATLFKYQGPHYARGSTILHTSKPSHTSQVLGVQYTLPSFDQKANTLRPSNHLLFRCRLDSQLPSDVHRVFSGGYDPRWRTIYINEIKTSARGEVRLVCTFPQDVYQRADSGSEFMTSDFTVGNKINLGLSLRGEDIAPKTFVVTDVDTSNLATVTVGPAKQAKQFSDAVIRTMLRMRHWFTSESPVLGLKFLLDLFYIVHPNGTRSLTKSQFQQRLRTLHSQESLTQQELDQLFLEVDENGDLELSLEEFLTLVQATLSERRIESIIEAFQRFDYDRDGYVTVKDFQEGHHFVPELEQYLFEWRSRPRHGRITFSEFLDYFTSISFVMEEDDTFEQLLCSLWWKNWMGEK